MKTHLAEKMRENLGPNHLYQIGPCSCQMMLCTNLVGTKEGLGWVATCERYLLGSCDSCNHLEVQETAAKTAGDRESKSVLRVCKEKSITPPPISSLGMSCDTHPCHSGNQGF